MMQLGCSVVVPVYNGADTLELLVQRLGEVLPSVASAFEVIFVNDGSKDNSWEVITRLCKEHDWVRGINLMRNFGQHNALLCGIRAARYEITVTMDDDLQNPPDEIPALLGELLNGHDVVYGVPAKAQHGIWRDAASKLTKLALQSAMGAKTARNVSAFRAFRTYLRTAFTHYTGPYVSIDVLLTWGTTNFSSVRVRHDQRLNGISNYSFGKLVEHALNMITGFSTIPLQVASILGFIFTLFGIGVLVYVIVVYLINGGSVPGFPFLASIIAIFSGAQLLALGIIGEYLARMYSRTMGRPQSSVRERLGFDE